MICFCFVLADINYFHCQRIVALLKETEDGTKNIFGRYSSQRMKASHLKKEQFVSFPTTGEHFIVLLVLFLTVVLSVTAVLSVRTILSVTAVLL